MTMMLMMIPQSVSLSDDNKQEFFSFLAQKIQKDKKRFFP
jgi:hypothetical protein